jgi:CubicO group peptidase (beta-lactamase class C family)
LLHSRRQPLLAKHRGAKGKLLLTDPVWKYLGDSWKKKNMRVYKEGSYDPATKAFETVPCERSITVSMLLTHTSGLSYGFDVSGKVPLMLRSDPAPPP